MALRENDYICILSPFVTKLGLSGNKLIVFSLVYGFCRDGEQEFSGSINYICEWTGISRNTTISILKELVESGLLEKRDYTVNGVKFCAYKVGSAIFAPPMQKLDGGSAISSPNIIEDNLEEKKIDKSISQKFEECWIAYRRKGVKQKARQYWNKLKESEKDMVMPHIKAYVSSRDIQYQKDFERYLRDKVFLEVVFKNNQLLYDPEQMTSTNYMPHGNLSIMWDDNLKAYLYIGFYSDGMMLADGYENDNRPDGASLVLNNGRGTITWSSTKKIWERE